MEKIFLHALRPTRISEAVFNLPRSKYYIIMIIIQVTIITPAYMITRPSSTT